MWISDKWVEYELIDCSGGERLERWGDYILIRPDPQVIWETPKEHTGWYTADARYIRSSTGGGQWKNAKTPNDWQLKYDFGAESGFDCLKFHIRLMNFKHTGIFPEQAANWEFITKKIREASRENREINVLNLFAYTGAATLAAAAAGANVCHVDAAKGMVARARDNAVLSGLGDKSIRWIVDDCVKFVEREIRRGRKYDALIMDPPSYGRGPSGEVWKLEDELYRFAVLCSEVLSENPLFVLINSYTTGLSPSTLTYIAKSVFGMNAESRELGLPVTTSGLYLPCGSTCRAC